MTWLVALVAGWLAVETLTHGAVVLGTLPSAGEFLRLDAGVSMLAVPFLALLAMLSFAVGVWSLQRARPVDIALIAVFALAMLGVLVARSVTAFFIAWEAMSLVSAFLVAAHHERRNVRRATLTYLIIAQAGAFCILAALCILALHAGSTSFTDMASAATTLDAPLRNAAFALALIGFGSKAGLMPLHFWLPRAHPVAPASASAMLSGIMLKVAVYGLCLVTLELAAPAPLGWGITLVLLGTVSAIGGVLYALVDRDLKRLLAYSSIENIGIVTIGLGVALTAFSAGNGAVAGLALIATFFHTINDGLFKGLLFLGAGIVADREGTVDIERLGGLWGRLVWTAPLFLIGCVAIAGIPPLNGFASEWLTFQSLIAAVTGAATPVKLVLVTAVAGLALTSGLAAACFAKVFGTVFLGRRRSLTPREGPRETFDPSVGATSVLALLCIALGLVPALTIAPLAAIAAATLHVAPLVQPMLPVLPVSLAALPFAGALLVLILVAVRGVRRVPTWTCGSPVTAAAQYTGAAFVNPLRLIFAFVFRPRGRRHTRYMIDESARRFAAIMLRLTRRSRIVQSGSLRLYLTYAVATLIVVVAMVH